jgi:hypothetical protein
MPESANDALPPTGSPAATSGMPPAPNLPPRSQRMAAANATNQLFRFCDPTDVGDPEAFFAAVIGIFEEFPIAVMTLVADPVRGLPSRVHRPGLPEVRKACEDAYAPIARQLKRERVELDRKRMLTPPPIERMTVAELEAKIGHPLPRLRAMTGERFKNIDEAQLESKRRLWNEAEREREDWRRRREEAPRESELPGPPEAA